MTTHRASLDARHPGAAHGWACAALLLASLLSAGARAQTNADAIRPAGAEAGRGAITGRVVGEGGEPLAHVAVFVQGRGPLTQRTATTDAEGNFAVADLAPGLYGVSAVAPGYVSEPPPAGDAAGGALRPGDTTTVRMTKGGVITGRVTDAGGEPVVAVGVRVFLVRSLDGEAAPPGGGFVPFGGQTQTDDRGLYRAYGLRPGVYVVATGASFGPFSPYEGDVQTFHPSGTRDTAAEVVVRAGQETAGVDIRYRDDRGHVVSGAVELPADLAGEQAGASVTLIHAPTGTPVNSAFVPPREAEHRFQIEGVTDGDYEVRATVSTPEGVSRTSPPQPVSVRGADVTGLKLRLAPLASVSGVLAVEPPPAELRALELCKDLRPRLLPQEVFVTARREEPEGAAGAARARQFTRAASAPDETGAFTLRNLEAGRYRVEARPVDESLYVRAVSLPSAAPAKTPRAAAGARAARPPAAAPAPNDSVALAAGQRLSGASVRVAFGAALLAGRVAPAQAAADAAQAGPGGRTRVYLLPAGPESANDPLRYAETTAAEDGSFVFKNVAPGRYLLVTRHTPTGAGSTPPSLSAAGRAALRREAEAARVTADLQPCQRMTNFEYAPAPTPAPQK